MRRIAGLGVVLMVGLTGCTGSGHSPAVDKVVAQSAPDLSDVPTSMPPADSSATPSAPPDEDSVHIPIAPPSCPGTGHSPHFDTPQAAMVYLASAWNRRDLDEMCHVTNPNARMLLLDMHREAVNLRFSHCVDSDAGFYACYFTHDYPKRMHKKGIGHAEFDVAPADAPGWYMTVFTCG